MSHNIRWDENGVPHSLKFNDKYFCTQNGYEEYRHVAGGGNDLSRRLRDLDPSREGIFTVIETGFGTGMCFCCLWEMWETHAPKSWTLHYISIELYPLSTEEIKRALDVWPVLDKYKNLLSGQYQPKPGEVSHFKFNNDRVCLTLVFRDVVVALEMIREKELAPGMADVWLLNGFSPFANPRMWVPEVFAGMAKLSKPGTTLSTFTAAGHVRRGLQAAGFEVERVRGFGTKKQIIKGVFGIQDKTE